MKPILLLLLVLLFAVPSMAQEASSDDAGDEIYVVNHSSSLKKLQRSLEKSRAASDRKSEGSLHNQIGDYYWYAGDYPLAAEHYRSALEIYERLNDSLHIAFCYRNIGWIYIGQQDYPQTKKYFNMSLGILKRHRQYTALISAYDDLGILYREMKRYPESVKYFEESIRLARLYKKDAIGTSTISLATSYREMGQYGKAITEYNRAISLQREYKDPYNISYAYIDMGRCYTALKDGRNAVLYVRKGLDIAKKNKFKKVEIEAIQYLGPAYEAIGDFQQAYRYSNLYAQLADSMINEKQERDAREMLAKYESTKKETQIRSLEKQKQFSNEKLAQERKFMIWLSALLMIMLALAFFFFRSWRQKQKANHELSLTYAELATKNKDIEDSINYAKQIQHARLPDPGTVSALFPQSFVLFLPKDVVSGDFYWFSALKNGHAAFAAADCTGHGVPGAFMSLIGMDAIHQAVNEKALADPSRALSLINLTLKQTLRQNHLNSSSRDGMDIALCIYDPQEQLLHYAGAHRPLLLVRDGDITEIKATKHSIGGLTSDTQLFEGHTLQLQAGDTIYLFSDGYADQFGGPEDKKFSTRRFKQQLLDIHAKPMEQQESILIKAFSDWKGETEQIDDVLVIGIRV